MRSDWQYSDPAIQAIFWGWRQYRTLQRTMSTVLLKTDGWSQGLQRWMMAVINAPARAPRIWRLAARFLSRIRTLFAHRSLARRPGWGCCCVGHLYWHSLWFRHLFVQVRLRCQKCHWDHYLARWCSALFLQFASLRWKRRRASIWQSTHTHGKASPSALSPSTHEQNLFAYFPNHQLQPWDPDCCRN